MAPSRAQPVQTTPHGAPSDRSARLFSLVEAVGAAFVLLAVFYGLGIASRWPLVHDAPLMHYVVFLMDRGWAPYRDIVEMNMPGSYMQAWAVIHLLGNGARGWFAWDALTGVTAILAGAWITGPGRRATGLAGGGLAYLMHLSDGAWNEGQRDWVVAVLLLLAFGCVVQFLRGGPPAWMAGMVSLSAFATTIKPLVVVVPFALLATVVWMQKREGKKSTAAIAWACAGTVPPLLATALFLTRWGVWREFFATLRGIVALYAGLHNLTLPELLPMVLPHPVAALALCALALFVASRSWQTRESLLLLLGASCGVLFFLLQRKGWTYHQYTTVAFLLIWVTFEVHRSLRSSRAGLRYAAVVILAVATVWLPLRCLAFERRSVYPMATLEHLQSDLAQLGGSKLSGQVQCLDMALGSCINTLYRLQIVQSTGFIYDFYLFPDRNTPLTDGLRARFLAAMQSHPPRVVVLSSQDFATTGFGYGQLERWPALRDLLKTGYRLFSTFGTDPEHPSLGYRVYVENGTGSIH